MLWYVRIFIIYSLITCPPISSAIAQAEDGLVVRIIAAQARCIFEHPEVYLELPTDPAILVPAKCPKTDISDDEMVTTPRNSGPGMALPKTGTGDNVLILMKYQISCLYDKYNSVMSGASDTDLVTFDLSDCENDDRR